MAYPALTKSMIDQFKDIGLDNDQLEKAHQGAMLRLEEKQAQLGLFVHTRIVGHRKVLRLLLLGKTGAGKSSTGNLILGRNVFEASVHTESCTKTIEMGSTTIDDTNIMVIDTPGFLDTNAPPEQAITEMAKILELYKDGIDGILFVYSMGNPRFTAEEQEAFLHIQQGILGTDFINHCFIIITHGDSLVENESLDRFIQRESQSPFGQLLINTVDKRVIAVDNSEVSEYGQQIQREQIVRMIAAKTSQPCMPTVLKQLLKIQEDGAEKIDQRFHHLVPEIDQKIVQTLCDVPYDKMEYISSDKKASITDLVVAQLSDDKAIEDKDKCAASSTITARLQAVVKRLTMKDYLKKISQFLVPLFKAAWGK